MCPAGLSPVRASEGCSWERVAVSGQTSEDLSSGRGCGTFCGGEEVLFYVSVPQCAHHTWLSST